jgi:fructokinase
VVLTSGGEEFTVVPQGLGEVIDTVGAGDAFTSVMALGLLSGWEPPLMLERAQAFASAITRIRGATCNDPGFYRPFIDHWALK